MAEVAGLTLGAVGLVPAFMHGCGKTFEALERWKAYDETFSTIQGGILQLMQTHQDARKELQKLKQDGDVQVDDHLAKAENKLGHSKKHLNTFVQTLVAMRPDPNCNANSKRMKYSLWLKVKYKKLRFVFRRDNEKLKKTLRDIQRELSSAFLELVTYLQVRAATGQQQVLEDIQRILQDSKTAATASELRDFETQINLALMDLKTLIKDGFTKAAKANEDRRREAFFEWLAAPEPFQDHQDALKRLDPSTGEWLINSEAYKDWKTTQHHAQPPPDISMRSLWLHGGMGSGTTHLCSKIIQDMTRHVRDTPNSSLAYFYFSFAASEKDCSRALLASLVKQFIQAGSLPPNLCQIQESRQQATEDELCEAVIYLNQGKDHAWIILDGVDEVPDLDTDRRGRPRDYILKALKDMLDRLPKLSLLIVSQPLYDINCFAHDWPMQKLELDSKQVKNDILTYVRNELQRDLILSRLDSTIKTLIENAIIRRAGDMSRWAACQMHELKSLHSHRPQDVKGLLDDLPVSLDDYYERKLCRINQREVKYVQRALQWLAFDGRLLLPSLEEACIIDYEVEPYWELDNRLPAGALQKMMSTLVTVRTLDSDSEGVQRVELAHSSVKQFLMSMRILDSAARHYALNEGRAQLMLAQSCFAYMLCFFGPSRVRIRQENRALMRHALHYGFHHQRKAETYGNIEPDSGWLHFQVFDHLQTITENLKHTRYPRRLNEAYNAGMFLPCFGNVPGLHLLSLLGLSKSTALILEQSSLTAVNQTAKIRRCQSIELTPLQCAEVYESLARAEQLIKSGARTDLGSGRASELFFEPMSRPGPNDAVTMTHYC